jgi:hypothetical protein
MRRVVGATTALVIAAAAAATPALAEIITTDAGLAGKNFCWASGLDSEQYGRDHSYIYSYHMWSNSIQYVIHGAWTVGRDGVVTLKIEGGATLVRRYEIDGERVNELTGSLAGGADGHVC